MLSQQSDSEVRRPSEYIDEINFQKYWLVLKRRWMPALFVFSGAVVLALIAALMEDPVYQAEGKIRFKSDRTSALTGLEEERGRVEVLNFRSEPLQTQAEIVKSLPVMERAVETARLKNSEGELMAPQSILNMVNVEAVPGTEILRISSTSGNPETAQQVVNAVIQAYRQLNIESNKQEAAAARQFIEDQLPTIERQVLEAEIALRNFKDANGVVALEQETENAVSRLDDLNQQIEQTQIDLSDIQAQANQLQGQLGVTPDAAIVLSSLNQSAGVQSALSELQAIETEMAELRSLYSENHPQVKILQREQAATQALLQERIQDVAERQGVLVSGNQIDFGELQVGDLRLDLMGTLADLETRRIGLTDRLSELARTREQYLQQMGDWPELEKTQRQLERQLDAAQTTYETLLTQLQEIRIVENQTVGNVQVVSLANLPANPMGPNRKLFLVAGGAAGIIAAIAIAFLLDLLDSSVKTIKELKELYGYTLLGVIPLVKESGRPVGDSSDVYMPRLLVNRLEHAGVREAYQILQANLKFLQSDTEIKTVVITSAVTGEGKSEVSVNLAAALAQVGKKVLIIDADMRYPRQHRALQVMNHKGLSHVITGQAALEDCLQTVMENLDVLTAGAVPPNPVALLDSKRMHSLLDTLSARYDMIILDAPPLAGYADATILGRMSNGILLVARPNVVNYTQGRIAKDVLTQSQQRVLGMVANGVNPVNEPDAHFYLRQDHYPVVDMPDVATISAEQRMPRS